MWAADDAGASLVEFVPGEPLVSVAASGRLDDAIWRRLGRSYARVHAVRFPGTVQGPYTVEGPTLSSRGSGRDLLEAVTAAQEWARDSALLNGDANFHNIVSGPQGVTLIDWDVPAVGDPLQELAGLEGHAYLHGFPELPAAFHEGYGMHVPRELLRLYRIVGHLQVLSSPGWARMIAGRAGLSPPVLSMVRGVYDGWSTWMDDLPELVRGW